MQFAQLGELTNSLIDSEDKTVDKFPDEVDWYSLRGLRNRISHNYISIDAKQIWTFTIKEVPAIGESLQRILKKRYGK